MRKRKKNRSEQKLDFYQNRKENINLRRELREKSYHGHHTGEFRHRDFCASDSQADRYRRRIGDHRPRHHRLHDHHQHKPSNLRAARCKPNRQGFSPRRNRLHEGRFERPMHRHSYDCKMRLMGRSTQELLNEKRHLQGRLIALRCELRNRFSHRQRHHRRYSAVR